MTNKPFYESLVPTTLLLADKYWTQQMPEADKIMAIGMGGQLLRMLTEDIGGIHFLPDAYPTTKDRSRQHFFVTVDDAGGIESLSSLRSLKDELEEIK